MTPEYPPKDTSFAPPHATRGPTPRANNAKAPPFLLLLTMRPSDKPTRLLNQQVKADKAKRDAEIVEAFKRTGTIHEARRVFNFVHSREVVRSAISKAGIYDKCKRDNQRIELYKSKTIKPRRAWTYGSQYRSELEMQREVARLLESNGITYEAEVKLNGCSMRADFVGSNWAIETKKECDSQSMLVGLAQCQTYRKHLGKAFTCILLPDDLEPGQFYVSECLSYGIPVIKLSDLIWWVRTVENNAQPN